VNSHSKTTSQKRMKIVKNVGVELGEIKIIKNELNSMG
jgi:hypothetical protein